MMYRLFSLRSLGAIMVIIGSIVIYMMMRGDGDKSTTAAVSYDWTTGLFWGGVILLAGLFASKLPGNIGKYICLGAAALGALILIFSLRAGFGEGTSSGARSVARCVNTECSPEAGEKPKTYGDGHLTLKPGEVKTIILAGKIEIPNGGHERTCVDVTPKGVFDLTWNSDVTRVFVAPKPGEPQREATIQRLRIGEGNCR